MITEKIIIKNHNIKNIIIGNIICHIFPKKIYFFTGLIGAGKTTIIKEIIQKINPSINDHIIQSPYFSIIKNYKNILHSDITKGDNYLFTVLETVKIKNPEYIFIEYAGNINKIKKLLNKSYSYININIDIIDEYTRSVSINYI